MIRSVLTTAALAVALATVSGCGHYYHQQQADAFAQRVADKCVDAAAAARQTVVVLPAATAAAAPAAK